MGEVLAEMLGPQDTQETSVDKAIHLVLVCEQNQLQGAIDKRLLIHENAEVAIDRRHQVVQYGSQSAYLQQCLNLCSKR
jgi:hypothetical protein